jgi:hypothetical protein
MAENVNNPKDLRTRGRRHLRLRSMDDLDGRTNAARKTREIVSSLSEDLGGAEHLTSATRQLVQRAALLGAIAEDYEMRWLAGDRVHLTDYFTTVNTQHRVLLSLGLERRARDVSPPSLREYLRRRPAEAAE